MLRIRIMALGAVLSAVMACKQDDLPIYSGEKFVVIGKTWINDDEGYSFSYIKEATLDTTQVSLNLEVKLMGTKPADSLLVVPYTLTFESDDLGPAGMPGQRYQLEGSLSGNRLTDTIVMTFYRDRAFMDTVYYLKVSLGTAADYHREVGGAERLAFFSVLEISIDDRYIEPDWWKSQTRYLGDFSSRKIRTIYESLGWQSEESRIGEYWLGYYMDDVPMTIVQLFNRYLENKARAGDPIRERDGSLMQRLVYE